jgi:hypothetical protein
VGPASQESAGQLSGLQHVEDPGCPRTVTVHRTTISQCVPRCLPKPMWLFQDSRRLVHSKQIERERDCCEHEAGGKDARKAPRGFARSVLCGSKVPKCADFAYSGQLPGSLTGAWPVELLGPRVPDPACSRGSLKGPLGRRQRARFRRRCQQIGTHLH